MGASTSWAPTPTRSIAARKPPRHQPIEWPRPSIRTEHIYFLPRHSYPEAIMSSRDDRSASGTEPSIARDLSRRDALKLAAAAVALPITRLQARVPKRVI